MGLAGIFNYGYCDPVINANDKAPTAAGIHSFFFNGRSLKTSLEEIARNNGMTIHFSDKLSATTLKQAVNGQFSVATIKDLLTQLGGNYGFNWFIYSGQVYITSNTDITEKIAAEAGDLPAIHENLRQMGLLDSRFGYAEMPQNDNLVITGPAEYVQLIREQVTGLSVTPIKQQFAIYRLKYANATDLQYTFNNQLIIIPGVATVLQNLFRGTNSGKNSSGRVNSKVNEMISNKPSTNKKTTPTTDDSTPNDSSSSSDGRSSSPWIQADARLNTIIIRDKSNNLPIYRQLIEELDVQAPLIQVEVLVFKLNQDKLSEAGVNWWFSGDNSSVGFGAQRLNSGQLSNNLSFSYNQVSPGNLMVTDGLSFANSLRFLEQNQYAQTVAKPSLATIDNIPAIVSISKIFYASATTTNTSGDDSEASNALIDGSITQALEITPHVIFDGEKRSIRLSITLEDGSIEQSAQADIPSTTQSQISSQAIVDEGQSVILAGYTKESKRNVVTKIPGLGDIPFIGWLFTSKTTINNREVTLYLVTPKIITERNTLKLVDQVTIGDKKIKLPDDKIIISNTPSSAVSNDHPKRESQE